MSDTCVEHQKEIHDCLKIEETYLQKQLAAAREEIKRLEKAFGDRNSSIAALQHQNQKLRETLKNLILWYAGNSSLPNAIEEAKLALGESEDKA